MRNVNNYDVIVVGGGPGGVGAAVTAGTAGARVLLIERGGYLGGAGTAMLVNPFMPPLTFPGPNDQPPRKVMNAGTFQRACERLEARGAAKREVPTSLACMPPRTARSTSTRFASRETRWIQSMSAMRQWRAADGPRISSSG